MRVNNRTIVIVLAVVAAMLVVAVAMRGEGVEMLHRLGASIHGQR